MGGALALSGDRIRTVYRLLGTADEARARADDICIEQTVEFPPDLVERRDIREQIFGRVAALEAVSTDRYEAVVELPAEAAGEGELTQLLNLLYGNVSLKPGLRLQRFELPARVLERFAGPRFGVAGLRRLLGVAERPLVATAIKPMGLSPAELAEMAYHLARGGVDMIKDDHGLADQAFCRFDERVTLVSAAVRRANEEVGGRCLYFPNVTGPADRIVDRARRARDAGAGGLVISPGLSGLDAMRRLADDDSLGLPLLAHPALLGSFTVSPDDGIAHGALYGHVMRLAGADAVIFPTYGGRFSFSKDECRDLTERALGGFGQLAPCFPVPAGGMTVDRVPEMRAFYGDDVVLLIGGDLHRGDDLEQSCREFLGSVAG